MRKTNWCAVLAAGAAVLVAGARAEAALYAATGAGTSGELYLLNPATGAMVTDIGPTNDALGGNYGITGMAFNPATGVLYASADNKSAGPGSLLTINPATGRVTVLGSFGLPSGNTMTDLAFSPSGTLYGISSTGGSNLYTVNIATGAATEVGPSEITFTEGGGIAVSPGGTIYATPIPGDFGTYDPATGAFTQLGTAPPVLTDTPTHGYTALSFDNGGVLYGVNLAGAAKLAHLATINLADGTTTDIGPSVTQLDSLAFSPAPVPEPGCAAVLAGVVVVGTMRRRRGA